MKHNDSEGIPTRIQRGCMKPKNKFSCYKREKKKRKKRFPPTKSYIITLLLFLGYIQYLNNYREHNKVRVLYSRKIEWHRFLSSNLL